MEEDGGGWRRMGEVERGLRKSGMGGDDVADETRGEAQTTSTPCVSRDSVFCCLVCFTLLLILPSIVFNTTLPSFFHHPFFILPSSLLLSSIIPSSFFHHSSFIPSPILPSFFHPLPSFFFLSFPSFHYFISTIASTVSFVICNFIHHFITSSLLPSIIFLSSPLFSTLFYSSSFLLSILPHSACKFTFSSSFLLSNRHFTYFFPALTTNRQLFIPLFITVLTIKQQKLHFFISPHLPPPTNPPPLFPPLSTTHQPSPTLSPTFHHPPTLPHFFPHLLPPTNSSPLLLPPSTPHQLQSHSLNTTSAPFTHCHFVFELKWLLEA